MPPSLTAAMLVIFGGRAEFSLEWREQRPAADKEKAQRIAPAI